MSSKAALKKEGLPDLQPLIHHIIKPRRIGHLVEVPLTKILPDRRYGVLLELLQLFDDGLFKLIVTHRKTEYYRVLRERMGEARAYWRMYRYYRMFHDIKERGYDMNNPSPIVILASGKFYFRFDGSHRSSILRYLGYETCPAILVTPKDIEECFRQILAELEEPAASDEIIDTIGR